MTNMNFIRVWSIGLCFRIFGYGISMMSSRKHPINYSERYGFITVYRIFGVRIMLLNPAQLEADK